MRPTLALFLVLAACAPQPSGPSPSDPGSVVSEALEPLPPVAGLPYDDPRLEPVIAELAEHPEWLDAPLGGAPTVLALVPGVDHVCLALRGTDAGDVYVGIAPGATWSVASVALDRGEAGREIRYDTTGLAEDICYFVIQGRREPRPPSSDGIDVTGSVAGDEARVLAQALYARPDAFGIDLHGVPELLVGDPAPPAQEGWRCWRAILFVGGPRAEVVVGTRQASGEWDVASRVTKQALAHPVPSETAC